MMKAATQTFDAARFARKLTAEQAEELCHHSGAFSPPFNPRRARALWQGIKPKNEALTFLLVKEYGACRYRLSHAGMEVKEELRRGGVSRPSDLARLVIAARRACYESDCLDGEIGRELEQAVEAFASHVPWEDEPSDAERREPQAPTQEMF